MATCSKETGFLFWKKRCENPSIGACDECRRFTCQMHGGIQGDGGLLCNACLNKEEDSGSWFSWSSDDSSSSSSSSSGSSWSGSDSSSSSSSSDSGGGGGDSGGSSRD